MSQETYFDSAIIPILQKDTPITRKTVEWMSGGQIQLSHGEPYNVLPRELSGTLRTGAEVDLNLQDVKFILQKTGEEYNVFVHGEVEASGSMEDLRVFEYDYALAKNRQASNKNPLEFPVTFVTVLKKPNKVEDNKIYTRGFDAKNSFGKMFCTFRYYVRYMTDSCIGTLFGPVRAAMEKDSLVVVREVARAIKLVKDGIPNKTDSHHYEHQMLLALEQRHKLCLEDLKNRDLEDPEVYTAVQVFATHLRRERRIFYVRCLVSGVKDLLY